MPIYQYLCQACGHELEVIQKHSDDPMKLCPECDKRKLKKKITASVFRLSGGGWYETDFKTGDKKNLSGDKQATSEGGDKGASSASGVKESTRKDGDGKTSEPKKAESKSPGADSKSKPAASGAN